MTGRLCSPEQAEQALREVGLLEAVRGAGPKPRPFGQPRKPTRQDYLDMGVDQAVLDQIAVGTDMNMGGRVE